MDPMRYAPSRMPATTIAFTRAVYTNAVLVQELPLVAHHQPARGGDGQRAVAQECVVEALPGRTSAARGAPVIAQLADHQLAQRVVEVRGIERAARRLLPRRAGILIGLLAEHTLGVGLAHP